MCGICGIHDLERRPVDRSLVEKTFIYFLPLSFGIDSSSRTDALDNCHQGDCECFRAVFGNRLPGCSFFCRLGSADCGRRRLRQIWLRRRKTLDLPEPTMWNLGSTVLVLNAA
jgi:hypothetical protein